MNHLIIHSFVGLGLSALLLAAFPNHAEPANKVTALQVEYQETPIGIDVQTPRFSWQMSSDNTTRGIAQRSYSISVKDESGNMYWSSGEIQSDKSLGILYTGKPLQAASRYFWSVSVKDNKGGNESETSWFETGLMNPDPSLSAWSGAQWIGGNGNDLVFYSHYFPIYVVNYSLAIEKGSTHASFILGANDSRLMDKNKNLFGIASGLNGSYIKVEMDIADVANGGKAKVNVYRVGYSDNDNSKVPLKTFVVKSDVINTGNANDAHRLSLDAEFGQITITMDGNSTFFEKEQKEDSNPNPYMRRNEGASVNLNPLGQGGNYIPYGLLCDMGFSLDAGQNATFSNIEVRNKRMPQSLLRGNDFAMSAGLTPSNGAYKLSGGSEGFFVTADPSRNAMPMLRTGFNLEGKQVVNARLYVTSRGIYEFYINGHRVGNDYYNPGLTQYNKTHYYQTYNVTSLLTSGKNAMGAMMGEGWWSGLLSFGSIWNHFGDRESLLAKLVISFSDGSTKVVVTNDKDWKYYNQSPIIYSSLDMGEVYDATREAAVNGWSTSVFDDSEWQKAVTVPIDGSAFYGTIEEMGHKSELNYDHMQLVGQIGNNAGIYEILTAKSMKEVRPGVYVYDMGQNFVGVPRIVIHNGQTGRKITLRYAEILYPNLPESKGNVGMLMLENYRAALCQDIYTEKEGEQTIQPHFTFRGYQYIEITGIDKPLPLEDVKGVAISSVHNLTASYETSNQKVNRLWKNLTWSNIDNFLTIPTDCPQRNERMGWSGDISVFSPTATYLSNADQFMTRHLQSMRDVQDASGRFTDIAPIGGGFGGILWGSAGITIPWETYQQYGDLELLRLHYKAMVAYIDYLNDNIDKSTGRIADSALGDWLGPQNNQLGSAFPVTAYHIYDLGIMTKVATLLGNTADAQRFAKMQEDRKAFFNKTFVNADKKTVGLIGGPGFGTPRDAKAEFKEADLQTAYAVGLALGAFSEENVPVMRQHLLATVQRENKDDSGIMRPPYSLMTGFIGTSWISKALSDCGYTEAAYRLLQTETYPSWLYSVNQGATSIWERLNGYTVENGFGGNNSMNSFNHYSFGAVGRWMIAYSLGIQRDEPGFHHFILQPEQDPSGQMTHAEGYYDSPYGRIESAWSVADGVLTYVATVPANTTAQLYLPAQSAKSVTEGGTSASKVSGVKFLRFENGKAVYQLQSGHYSFKTTL